MEPEFICNLCGPGASRHVLDARDHRYDLPGSWTIVACAACGLRAVHPQPDPETLARHYPDHYYTLVPRRPTAKDRLNRLLDRLAWTVHVGTKREPPSGIRRWLHRGLGSWEVLRRRAEEGGFEHLRSHPGAPLLEIGFGDGAFLRFVARRGYEVLGVDFDRRAVDNLEASGLPGRVGELTSLDLPAAGFDAVRMRHVLEHVRDPLATLREVRRILRPDGRLLLEVPNADSLWAEVFGEFWAQLEVPRHLYHWTPGTLQRTLDAAGFRTLRSGQRTLPWHLLESLRTRQRVRDPGSPGVSTSGRLSSSLHRLSREVTRMGRGDNLLVVAAPRPGSGARVHGAC